MRARGAEERFGQDLVEPLLRRVLLAIAVGATLIAISSAVLGVQRVVVSSALNAVVAGVMLQLVRRGAIFAAALIESFTLTISTIDALVSGYGLLDVSILILPALFLLTSVLLSARWTFVVAVVANSTVLWIGFAEKRGWLVTPNSALVEYDDIVDAVILLTITAAFVHYLVSTLRHAIVQSRLAQARTREILDATSDAIVIHEATDGAIVEVNATTLRMFGCSRKELLANLPGLPGSGGPLEYVELALQYVRRVAAHGPQSFEWQACDKQGNEFCVEAMLRAARIGDKPCVVAVLRDITARRRLEERVRETERLRALGQLAGGIAHDFNNQLMAIFGNAEFVLAVAGNNMELRSCAESILSSGQRAADLTRQLLAFARRARRQNVPVDIHQLVTEVLTLARRSIDKRIVLEQELAADGAVTLGDASALQNALLNMLLNARDAMPSGGMVRFVTRNVDVIPSEPGESESSLSPGRYIEIQVTDTGVGIEPQILDRIFEPFFTTKAAGTGMGLAAVQGTVIEHQGAVEVCSEVGRGSTFRLWLPVTDAPHAIELRAALVPPLSKNSGRILVVDDEASVASVIEQSLTRGGYEVSWCSEGRQALELYRCQRFDLVLLDVMMPDLDGVEVLRRLRAGDTTACAMIMTGHAPESVQARLRAYPGVTILPKPFLPRELLQAVQSALGQAGAS